LVIELHKRIAIPLLQVTCILDQPQNLTPANANRDGFQGYFSRRGETIALVDLRERLGAGQVQHEKAQVLMTGDTKKQIGFLVDHVLGIEVSQWRTTVKDDPPAGQEPLVQLGAGRTAQVLPFMDLAKLMA
ncbi:MAG: chemotaxis protein CheW, partial [Pseudomonadota bacterium]